MLGLYVFLQGFCFFVVDPCLYFNQELFWCWLGVLVSWHKNFSDRIASARKAPNCSQIKWLSWITSFCVGLE